MQAIQIENIFEYLKLNTKKGCESCLYDEYGYCKSSIGCDWVGEMFHGTHNSWIGYKQNEEKIRRTSIKIAQLIEEKQLRDDIKSVEQILSGKI